MANIFEKLRRDVDLVIDEYQDEYLALDFGRLGPERRELSALPEELGTLPKVFRVDLSDTAVEDLTPLAGLPEVQEMYLDRIPTRDLTPLSEYRTLEKLRLCDVQITDLSFLRNMTELRYLDLSGTWVTDLTPVANCKKLEELTINDTGIADLSPLAGLKKLSVLNADRTAVSDLTPMSTLAKLTDLSATGAAIRDLAPLAGLLRLKRLRLDRTQVSDLSPLAGLKKLTDLSLNYCPVWDLQPLQELTKLSLVYLKETSVQDVSPLAAHKLRDLCLDGSKLNDLRPLKSNKSIPRLSAEYTGVSFRDTPLTEIDPDRLGAIALIGDPEDRIAATYRYLSKLKEWPPTASATPIDLLSLPEAPQQEPALMVVEGMSDILDLGQRPIGRMGALKVNLDSISRLLEEARGYRSLQELDDTRIPEGIAFGALVQATSGNLCHAISKHPVLDWLWLELLWLEMLSILADPDALTPKVLSPEEQELEAKKQDKMSQIEDIITSFIPNFKSPRPDPKKSREDIFLAVGKLSEALEKALNGKPRFDSLMTYLQNYDRSVETETALTAVEKIIRSFETADIELFWPNLQSFAIKLFVRPEHDVWRIPVMVLFCRNITIAVGSIANSYMEDDGSVGETSQYAFKWLHKHKKALLSFSKMQDQAFADWTSATLSNVTTWMQAGMPLSGYSGDDDWEDDDLQDDAYMNFIWAGSRREF